MVTDIFHLPYKPDRRHVRGEVIEYILKLFEANWCSDSQINDLELLEAFVKAQVAARSLPADLEAILAKHRPWRLREFLAERRINPDPTVADAQRATLERLLTAWRHERVEREALSGVESQGSAAG